MSIVVRGTALVELSRSAKFLNYLTQEFFQIYTFTLFLVYVKYPYSMPMWFVIINNNNGMTADRLTSMSSLYVYPA